MTYNDLTIDQFIRCVDATLEHSDRLDRDTAMAAVISGKTVEEIEQMDFNKSDAWYSRVKSIEKSEPTTKIKHFLILGGKAHKALTDIGTFSTSRLLSLLHYNSQENRHRYLAERIALLYTPYFSKQNEESCYPDYPQHKIEALANEIRKRKVSDVYGAVFFFARLWNDLSLDTQDYLKLIQMRAQALGAEMTLSGTPPKLLSPVTNGRPSRNTMAGTSTSTSSPKTTLSKKMR